LIISGIKRRGVQYTGWDTKMRVAALSRQLLWLFKRRCFYAFEKQAIGVCQFFHVSF